jgi:4-hydroxy-3-methylbut-2-enyl diphosphate reductase
VADGGDIDPNWVSNAEVVVVTAGASAPEIVVEDVVRRLIRIAPSEVVTFEGPQESVNFRLPSELTTYTKTP